MPVETKKGNTEVNFEITEKQFLKIKMPIISKYVI